MKAYKNHIAMLLICTLAAPSSLLRAADSRDRDESATLEETSKTTDSDNGTLVTPVTDSETAIKQYQDRINQLESDYGVYHPDIAETLLSLGLSYRAGANNTEATDAFNRALQISRVNYGLHSLEQIPYLEFLIEGNRALENWEDLNNNYFYLYWLYKRNYGENDTRLLAVIDRVTQAQVEIFNSNPDLFTARNLKDRKEMIEKSIEIIEGNYGEYDERLVHALNQLILTNYYIALQTGYFNDYRDYRKKLSHASTGEMTRRIVVPQLLPGGRVIYRTIEIPNTKHAAYLKPEAARKHELIHDTEVQGRKSFKRIEKLHDNNPNLSLYSRVITLVHQGDWLMLYESSRGLKQYQEAFELLEQADGGDVYIERLFGQPRTIPAFLSETEESLTAPLIAQAEKEDQSYLEISYDVTPAGRVVNIQVINQPSVLDDSAIRRVKRYLKYTRFRPRFEHAKPVMTRDIKAKYPVNANGQLMARSG